MTAHEIITRRNLPHWYVPGMAHFITYRLAGTIPIQVMERLRRERQKLLKRPPESGNYAAGHKARVHKQFFASYDQYLDQPSHINWLARSDVSAIIRENLYFHDGQKYHLLEYCAMPNHVHVVLQPIESDGLGVVQPQAEIVSDEMADGYSPLSSIMHSLKGYTASKINALLGRSGQFWQHESYDHWVRDEEELFRIIEYIRQNPVLANLADSAEAYHCCSARDRAEGIRAKP